MFSVRRSPQIPLHRLIMPLRDFGFDVREVVLGGLGTRGHRDHGECCEGSGETDGAVHKIVSGCQTRDSTTNEREKRRSLAQLTLQISGQYPVRLNKIDPLFGRARKSGLYDESRRRRPRASRHYAQPRSSCRALVG